MSIAESVEWTLCHFEQLSALQVYQIARLRIDVFVVEQACAYPELDGLDLLPDTVHLFAMHEEQAVAYARILTPVQETSGHTNPSDACMHTDCVRIGRVLVAQPHRRRGLATQLMHRALDYCKAHRSGHDIVLAAQVEIMDFYAGLAFVPCSEQYFEDGIAHVDMQRGAP